MKVTKSKESKASAEDIYKLKLDWLTEDYACLMLLQPEHPHVTHNFIKIKNTSGTDFKNCQLTKHI